MLRFRSLASGSAGNATLVEAASGATTTRVLIDCGLGARQLTARLAAAGLAPADLHAIFITHEHGDHVGCAPAFAARHGIALWTSPGTWQALGQPALPDARLLHWAHDGAPCAVGDVLITPFTVPHDARQPLQLTCTDGARRLGLLTDLGHVTPHALRHLNGCEALLLECNHDPDLLAASHYPPFLKRRIAGPHGHLSNAQAAAALAALHHDGLHTVAAAHLSERHNRPALAQAALAGALGCAPADVLCLTPEAGGPWLSV
ncbi:MAG: MBL fold metallo-hydrolase [Comamonadaceae bacterium]|nr:MBL fold metallo-hydrolase [Comamonadaceae bacterium]